MSLFIYDENCPHPSSHCSLRIFNALYMVILLYSMQEISILKTIFYSHSFPYHFLLGWTFSLPLLQLSLGYTSVHEVLSLFRSTFSGERPTSRIIASKGMDFFISQDLDRLYSKTIDTS